jgi:hypothetical protein
MDRYATDDGLSAPLRQALTECAATRLSGMLLVGGDPGGVVHLANGAIAAIQTPGAPGAEVILLRSHRVSEADWDVAFAAAASNGRPMGEELVARGAVGTGELEALLWVTLADAMFVLASGLVEECKPQPGPVDCLLPLIPGAEAVVLLGEAARRMEVLAAQSGPVQPGPGPVQLGTGQPEPVQPGPVQPWMAARSRDRFVAARGARRSRRLGHGQDEILAMADGRRTARDIAFALGHGVYATMLQLARMREAGVLATVPLSPLAPLAESASAQSAAAQSVLDQSARDQPGALAELPQRRRGLPVLPRRTADEQTAASKPMPYRLLRPRQGRNSDPGAE